MSASEAGTRITLQPGYGKPVPPQGDHARDLIGDSERLPWHKRIYNLAWVRKLFVFLVLMTAWELYARHLDNPLMFPRLTDTVTGLFGEIGNGELPARVLASFKVQLTGYLLGILLAGLLTVFAITSRFGADLMELLTAILNPLPPIALLPLALLWFGLGSGSIVFVIVHAVMWPVAINIYSGFTNISPVLRMLSRNYELSTLGYVFKIAIPAALPSILTGLKVGWAFSWRTLIASELVFGVSSGSGGLGWFIFEKKNQLDINLVFAGLLTIIVIGLVAENYIFKVIANRTIGKWGVKG